MTVAELIAVLFPHFVRLHVDFVRVSGRTVRLQVRGRESAADCSGCGASSARVHSRYERRISDTAVADQQTVLHLSVRRFFCATADCTKATFAEQIPDLTFRYGRCTMLLRGIRETIALALGGRPAARLTEFQAIGLGKDALLRLIRALPDPHSGEVRVLGVDDFALRKGHNYGTVLIDMETHRPVDVLPERSAEALATWLDAHPGTQVICRDRAGCYAQGAATGAPTATQVADRWHLWNNLGVATERLVARLRAQWIPLPPQKKEPVVPVKPESPSVQRKRERHALVHALMAKGVGIGGIVSELRLDPKTARKFMNAPTPEALISDKPNGRRSSLDGHAAYLAARFAEGCTSTGLLHQELHDRGARVSERTVRRFLLHLRENTTPTVHPIIPKNREVTTAVLTNLDNLPEVDRLVLQELRGRCEDLDAACRLVAAFAEMLVNRRGQENLDRWVRDAENSPLPELRGFATGLRRDWNAVKAGLTLHWNSGMVEGHVNRIKMIKRQMFGRAKPDLLRKRILLAH